MLLGMETADILLRMGHHAFGPVTTLSDALAICGCNRIDAAILDFDIAGEMVVPLARLLDGRDTPYFVCTGRPQAARAALGCEEVLILEKPVFRSEMQTAIRGTLIAYQR